MDTLLRPALREGYSTGACVAAACTAAWRRLSGEALSSVGVLFPDGARRVLPVLAVADPNGAALIKDGGDDPDCTHGAVIFARIRPCAQEEARPEDYLLSVGSGCLVLRGVEGIGLCTRPGLDCEPGKWAINVVPRRMIVENLHLAGLREGCWLVEIGVEGGAALALRTLNAQLGVLGGLSILGTTGIVRPYSHEAYIATIKLCVASLSGEGQDKVVFCTGGRTRAGARRCLPALPETSFVFIGDFIAESLVAARTAGMRSVLVACMPGKLCKYAAGFENTHAHRVGQDMALLRREAAQFLPEDARGTESLADCVSVREALLRVPENIRLPLLHRLAGLALERFGLHWNARKQPGADRGTSWERPELRLLLFDFEGHFLLDVADGIS